MPIDHPVRHNGSCALAIPDDVDRPTPMTRNARYCPFCGAQAQRRMVGGRWRQACPRCDYVDYDNPVVAAGTLTEQDGRVLLVRRSVEPRIGAWGLPAGYAEAGETPEDAAARETLEETGLRVQCDALLGIYAFGHQILSDGQMTPTGVLIAYAARPVGGSLRPGDDASEARFFAPGRLPDDIAFRTHREVLDEWTRVRDITFSMCEPADGLDFRSLTGSRGPDLAASDWDENATAAIVAHSGETRVGVAIVSIDEVTRSASLVDLCVAPSYRRWGIGADLLARAMAVAQSMRAVTMRARAPWASSALPFFRRAGFAPERLDGMGDAAEIVIMLSLGERE